MTEIENTHSQISLLIESFNAANEAQEKYSHAFIKILEKLEHVVDTVERVGETSEDDAKEIGKHLIHISEDLRSYHEASRAMKDALDQKFCGLQDVTRDFIRELQYQRHLCEAIAPSLRELERAMDEHQRNSQKQYDAVDARFVSVIASVEKLADQHKERSDAIEQKLNKLQSVPGQMAALTEVRTRWSKWQERGWWVLGAVGLVITVVGTAIQLGFIKLTFFPK